MSNTIIGSARCDEYGRYSGGSAGDQKQTTKPDYKGEVSMQTLSSFIGSALSNTRVLVNAS